MLVPYEHSFNKKLCPQKNTMVIQRFQITCCHHTRYGYNDNDHEIQPEIARYNNYLTFA